MIELLEEFVDGERAKAFLSMLAKNAGVRTDKKLFNKLENNKGYLTYCEINSKDPFAMAAQIKALFRKNHVYITSENENDIRFCRNLFFSVKRKNARTS